MSQEILNQYYQAWQTGEFKPEWFTSDFTFNGPIAQASNVDEFIAYARQWANSTQVESFQFTAKWYDSANNTAFAWYDFTTATPFHGNTKCAEFFTFENGKIKSIELVYDAREWEKAYAAAA